LYKIDEGLIRQALHNLLHNAMVYSPLHSRIEIRVYEEVEGLFISLKDTGPGIPEMYSKQVFERFFRLPETRPGGSGLGLSIVRGFVEAHGGYVKIISQEQMGTEVIVCVPAETNYLNHLKNE
jgi:two-component system sensor histidine kinase KdpD